jgi:hypothetical protein
MANETVQQFYRRRVLQISVAGLDGNRLAPSSIDTTLSWTDGNGDNQLLQVWCDIGRALGATTETLDLDGLTDFQGGSTSGVTKLKYIFIKNNSTGTMKIGGGDFTTPFADASDKLLIPAGATLEIEIPSSTSAYAITASTGDGLLVELTVAGTYDIVLGFV